MDSAIPKRLIIPLLLCGALLAYGGGMSIRPFVIPTGAMEDTLLVGDHLLVNTLTDKPDRATRLLLPRAGISRGDIVMIRPPSQTRWSRVVKPLRKQGPSAE